MFTRLNLERGEELYESGCVDSLDDKDNVYTATVKDNKHSYRTLAVIDEEELVSLKCNCQTSMNGSRCKHMAALLFEIEDEYAMEIFPKQERKKKRTKSRLHSHLKMTESLTIFPSRTRSPGTMCTPQHTTRP